MLFIGLILGPVAQFKVPKPPRCRELEFLDYQILSNISAEPVIMTLFFLSPQQVMTIREQGGQLTTVSGDICPQSELSTWMLIG